MSQERESFIEQPEGSRRRMRVAIGPVGNRKPFIDRTTNSIIVRIFDIYVESARSSIEGDELVSLVSEQESLLNDLHSRDSNRYREVVEKLIELKEKRRIFRTSRFQRW